VPTAQLIRRWWPGVPVEGDMSGKNGFFDCSKARRMLGWEHHERE
jgi:hypothetical protein